MSLKLVLDTLTNLGFRKLDAQVYVFLATKGSQKAKEICRALGLTKRQGYSSLQSLRENGMVNKTPQRPTYFLAVPFEKILDQFLETKINEAQFLEVNKEEIIAQWQCMNAKRNV